MEKNYYHFSSDGKLAAELFLSKSDFVAALNRLAVCKACFPDIVVLAFSFEDTHVHLFLYCHEEEGKALCDMFKKLTMMHISRTRGGKPRDLRIQFDDDLVDATLLKRVGAYVVIQPTKDGKGIMPYDYPWSSAPLDFRSEKVIPVWCVDKNGRVQDPVPLRDLSYQEKRKFILSSAHIPDDWLVCNGIILPSNYVDIKGYESIFGTHNTFRSFQTAAGDKDLIRHGVVTKGVSLPDLEMRAACRNMCQELFGASGIRYLNSAQRLEIARQLRKRYLMSRKQMSRIVHMPLEEIERFF